MSRQPLPLGAMIAILWITVTIAGIARAQTAPTSTESEEELKLERDFTDPLSTLPQLLIRDSYTPANYGPCTPQACFRNVETNQLLIRPLIPRIPPRTFLPFTQLIRPTFAVGDSSQFQGWNPHRVRRPAGFRHRSSTLARPKENRITDWYRADLCVSDRHLHKRRSGGVAGWSGAGSDLRRHSGTAGRLHRAEPGLVRLYLASPPAAEHTRVPTRFRPPSVGEMVPAIRGGKLEHGLASPFPDDVAAEPRTRPDLCTPRATPDELLCNGTMDAVPAIRTDRTSNHDKFRSDGSVPAVQRFLGPLESRSQWTFFR